MNHAVRDIEDVTVDVDGRRSAGRVADGGGPVAHGAVDGLVRQLVRRRQPADQAAARGEARRHLHEDGREQRGGGEAVAEAAVQVADDADGEGAERVCDLGVGREALGREVVDNVAGEGDDEHDGHLLKPALVDDDKAEGEGGHEDEFEPDRHGGPASGVVGRVLVNGAKDGGADRDAKAEKQRVYHRVDHADGTSDDVARLELKRATKNCVAR